MKFRFFVFAAAGFFCFQMAAGQVTTMNVADVQRGYMIGPGDVLSVKALGEKDFEIEAITVDEDGRIQIPYVNEPILAKCRTERELQAEVAKRWSRFLKNPQISLHVTQRNSRPPVSVIGEVGKEMQFDLTRRARLLEVLAAAGGATVKNGGMVQLVRSRPPMCADPGTVAEWNKDTDTGLGVSTRIYSLAAIAQGSNEANPEILPGDIINVPKAAPVYVTGEVMRAGEFDLPAGGLPLTQAIAMANGMSREATRKNVKIYRRKLGDSKPEVIVANLEAIKTGKEKDIMLEPFDIVEVGKAKQTVGAILLQALTGLPGRIPIPIRPL